MNSYVRGAGMDDYPKIPNKGRTSNKMHACMHAPLFWRNKMNWKIMGAHQIKSARELFGYITFTWKYVR